MRRLATKVVVVDKPVSAGKIRLNLVTPHQVNFPFLPFSSVLFFHNSLERQLHKHQWEYEGFERLLSDCRDLLEFERVFLIFSFLLSFISLHGQTLIGNVEVDQVNISSTAGDMGILSHHVPSIAQLKPGVVEVITGKEQKKFFASGGFAIMNQDSTLNINVVEAFPVEQLDAEVTSCFLKKMKIIVIKLFCFFSYIRPFVVVCRRPASPSIPPLRPLRRQRLRSRLRCTQPSPLLLV